MKYDDLVFFKVLSLYITVLGIICLVAALNRMFMSIRVGDCDKRKRLDVMLLAAVCLVGPIIYAVTTNRINLIEASRTAVSYEIDSIQQSTIYHPVGMFFLGYNEDVFVINANSNVYRSTVSSTHILSGEEDEIQINEYCDDHYDVLNVSLSPETAERLGVVLSD